MSRVTKKSSKKEKEENISHKLKALGLKYLNVKTLEFYVAMRFESKPCCLGHIKEAVNKILNDPAFATTESLIAFMSEKSEEEVKNIILGEKH